VLACRWHFFRALLQCIDLFGLHGTNSMAAPTFSGLLSKLDKNGSCRSPLAESEKLSCKGHSLLTWPHYQKFAWCASTVHMITTFVVCVMAVSVKDVSCYLRFQSSEMSNLLVHLVIQRSCPTRLDFTF
jgi:hypothetical protein